MAIYAIGDVQGCYDELEKLLALISFSPSSDQLWFVGDLVNRGPDSLKVLRFVKELKNSAITVLGNHDLHLLAVAYGVRTLRAEDTLQEVLAAPDAEELLFWLRHQPLLYRDQTTSAVLVHAGLPMQWDVTKALACAKEVELILQSDAYIELLQNMYGQEPNCWNDELTGWPRYRFIINALTRIRFCDLNGCLDLVEVGPPGSQPPQLVPWYKLPADWNDSLILFGHWAALHGVTHQENIIALDTGCAWGHQLSALRLDDRQWFQIDKVK